MEIPTAVPMTTASFDDCFRDLFPGVARAAALVARDPQLGPDIAQEAFARLYERWGRIHGPDHARNFVYKAAINLSRSHLRRRLAAPFGLTGPERSVPDPIDGRAEWLDAVDALGELSPTQRSCVVLVDYTGLEPADVASILGIADSTVRVHLSRGRRAARARLNLPQEEPS